MKFLYSTRSRQNVAHCSANTQFCSCTSLTLFSVPLSRLRSILQVVWKAYIDYQIEQEEFQKARDLYERLLDRTQHVKVWISFAKFELQADTDDNARLSAARNVFERAHNQSKSWEEKEARMLLLEAWLEFERESGTPQTIEKVQKLMPKKVKKRRKREAEDGTDAGWEEYFDWIFPSDVAVMPHLRFLEKAKQWKQTAATELEPSAAAASSSSAQSSATE